MNHKDKDWLYNEYIVFKNPINNIAEICNVGKDTIYAWLKKFDIKPDRNYKSVLTRELLMELYIENNMSTFEIADRFNTNHVTIANYLNKYGIQIRTYAQSQKIFLHQKGGNVLNSENQMKVWERAGYKDNMKNIHKESYLKNPNLSIEHSAKLQKINIADWKGFKENSNSRIRKSNIYKEWKERVFKRDNYICQCCENRGGKLNAHHVENFSNNEELRFDVNNGITLCENCHSISIKGSFHNIYGTFNNTKLQLSEYFTLMSQ